MELTPRQIVNELDKYIIGQTEAKKVVAVALRNRYRRSRLSAHDKEEITPKNIILKGPTGVGKTEIARRLAKLVKAPFLKVEATKYTEVGYVGRDVESMVRDLVEVAIRLVKDERFREVQDKATSAAVDKIAELLLKNKDALPEGIAKETVKDEILSHNLDHLTVEIDVREAPKSIDVGMGGGEINIGNIFGDMMPKRYKKRKLAVRDAMKILVDEEADKLIDSENVNTEAIRRAENDGIIFIDEIDKIAGGANHNGPDVSREGVQRDILPIVEGCTVNTKYGSIKTDYILFVASGAFHISSVSDLIPELQGRFPVRVNLKPLTREDFKAILSQTDNALTRQYEALLAVDHVHLHFEESALDALAQAAQQENETREDIGARRLHTLFEKMLEDISFNAGGDMPDVDVTINGDYVAEHLGGNGKKLDMRQYIL